jgi:hypothetical protein
MSDIYIRVRLCSNRHQVPQLQDSSKVAERQVSNITVVLISFFTVVSSLSRHMLTMCSFGVARTI